MQRTSSAKDCPGPAFGTLHRPYDGCPHTHVKSAHQISADAHKTGVAQETVKQAARAAGTGMSPQEARMVLEVDPKASWVDVTRVRPVHARLRRCGLCDQRQPLPLPPPQRLPPSLPSLPVQ